MVFSRVLTDVLRAACRGAGVTLKPSAVTGVAAGAGLSRVSFADGAAEDAALVVLASGKASARLREAAGIGWVGWEYEQSGIVATIRHERPHGGRACEHFLPAGPFAILPLPDDAEGRHQSSIVWTESSQDARTYLALPHEDLAAALETRFGLELGPLSVASTVTAWPLAFGMARRFISDRLALVGDAAHVIHPIAGQGLNLGLHDVAQLRDTVGDALRLGLDIGSADALKPYEQARRAATAAMGAVTDGLNRLFSNDVAPVRLARDLGLGLVDRMPALKARLIGEAAGSAAAPSLMRITPEDAPPPAA
jgi:2-octaprenyl-6-methoxyphenol hydroxylase